MILILQLINDPLDRFVNKEVIELETKLKNSLSLDNYSDDWLIRIALEEIRNNNHVVVILIRNGEAELKNLSTVIHQLPQINNVNVYYCGMPHPLIMKMKNFKNINLVKFNSIEELPAAL